ncbi:MAG: transposase, partial [Burkholderiaceae bacterium]|nr:transposase [Burkholderiaceae bacterium]
MARLPRLTVAGYPHHIVQRGNNRQPIVLDDGDRRQLLAHLQFCARQARVAIHAYVLMDNHLHLLLTPETDTGAPRMMQALGRAYVRYFNTRHGRSGTLWEGRYRCSVIEAETHLLPCMAYLALNPVRAGLASRAADYPWSSHAHLAGLRTDPLITRHPLYWALGNTPFAREAAYAALVEAAIGTTAEHTALGRAVHGNWALGSAAFMAALAQKTPRRAQQAPRGRPRKRA